MNLNITGIRLEVTPTLHDYVTSKLGRITRHVDHLIDVAVTLTVDKLEQKVAVDVHLRGKNIHVEANNLDMYAAIDAVADKLDRQVLKYKEQLTAHHADKVNKADKFQLGAGL